MTTPNLALEPLAAAQAQKHVTMNEALARLDAAAQLSVLTRGLGEPPDTPADGARYLIAQDASGLWADKSGRIAAWEQATQGWIFFTPQEGWRLWVIDESVFLIFQSGEWLALQTEISVNPVPEGRLGVNTAADEVNRLAVKSDAVLLSHDDVTPGNGSMRLSLNKAAEEGAASILFQTGYSARAEIGLSGSNAFVLKVSPDGSNFNEAFTVDPATGVIHFTQLPTGLPLASPNLTLNNHAALGNTDNMPEGLTLDRSQHPGGHGSFRFDGHYTEPLFSPHFISVDPNQIYRFSMNIKQGEPNSEYASYTHQGRHMHYVGLAMYDTEQQLILTRHHHFAPSSLTHLAAPLAPGDDVLHLADASSWENASSAARRRLIIFDYQDEHGHRGEGYSRIEGAVWNAGAVDFASNTVTLNAGLSQAMTNPADPSGIWPAGTIVANSRSSGYLKYSLFSNVLQHSERWYHATSHFGGQDRSGERRSQNFAPGTAYIRVVWLPNYTNRAGGHSTFPDTGADHSVWFAGVSIEQDNTARFENGDILVPQMNADRSAIEIQTNPPTQIEALF